MKLLTAEIEKRLEKHPFGSTDGQGANAEVIVKFFGGCSATWLVTEGEKQEDGDWQFYGAVTLYGDGEWEWGYFNLSELKNLRFPPFGLPIERDLYLPKHATAKELMGE